MEKFTSQCLCILIAISANIVMFAQTDTDADGMDDIWEQSQGLDPNNPKDAWLDSDQDQILNLFEFQLGTNPNNALDPSVVNLSSSDIPRRFQDLVASGYDGLVVMRLSEGDYNFGYDQGFYWQADYNSFGPTDRSFKVMIQGGWNQNFTEYNPFCFATNIFTDRDLLKMGSKGEDDETVVILDGLRVSGQPISVTGDIRYTLNLSNQQAKTTCSIYNCSITHSSGGIRLSLDVDAGPTQINIVNSNISNNDVNLDMFIPNPGTPTDINIINSVLTYGRDLNKGLIELNYNALDIIDVNVINSIVWDENFQNSTNVFPNKTINLNVLNSDFRGGNASSYSSYSNLNGFDVNPQFVDTSEAYYALPEGSVLENNGVDIGLAFRGSAPDIGINNTIMRVIGTSVDLLACDIEEGDIRADIYYKGPLEYSLDKITYQDDPVFRGLEPGTYVIRARSKSLCDSIDAPVILQARNIALQSGILSRYPDCTSSIGSIEIQPVGISTNYTYSLDGNIFQQSPIFDNLNPGLYFITIKDEDDCTYIVQYELQPNRRVDFGQIDVQSTTCGINNGAVELTLIGGIGPKLVSVNDGPFIEDVTYSNLQPGEYKFSIKDLFNCTLDSTIRIESSDSLKIDSVIVSSTSCGNDNGSLVVFSSPISASTMYTVDNRVVQAGSNFSDLVAKDYVVKVQDAACKDSILISIPGSAGIQLVADNFEHTSCGEENGLVELSAIGAQGPAFTYDSRSNTTGRFDELESGNLEFSVSDELGCVDTFTFEVLNSMGVALQMPQVTDASCNENFGQISNSSIGNGVIQYSLNGIDYEIGGIFENVPIGSYVIQARDDAGCRDSIDAVVGKVDAPVVISISKTSDECAKAIGTLDVVAMGGVGDLSYSIDSINYQSNSLFEGLLLGDYKVYIKDEADCINVEDVLIDGSPSLEIAGLEVFNIDCNNTFGRVEYQIVGGTGVVNAQLLNDDNQMVQEDQLNQGEFTLYLVDELGCDTEGSVSIIEENCALYIPNIFSVNGSLANQKFKISVNESDMSVVKFMQIRDRWGATIYQINNVLISGYTDWWDGTFNDQKVLPGVYPYELMIIRANGEEEMYTGFVTVVY